MQCSERTTMLYVTIRRGRRTIICWFRISSATGEVCRCLNWTSNAAAAQCRGAFITFIRKISFTWIWKLGIFSSPKCQSDRPTPVRFTIPTVQTMVSKTGERVLDYVQIRRPARRFLQSAQGDIFSHPILIRKYQADGGTTAWFRTYMWGVIYLRNVDPAT